VLDGPDEWLKEGTWKAWFACHPANFKRSIRRSQLITGFQLALFWSTSLLTLRFGELVSW